MRLLSYWMPGVVAVVNALLVNPSVTMAQGARAATKAPPANTTQSSTVDASDPKRLIETTAQVMLDELNANRAAYRKDPSKVHALVDRVLLPYFDTQFAARQVLGTHWNKITAEQRQRFIDAFYKSLLRNYGNALVDFTGDRLKILRAGSGSNPDRAVVYTQVKRDNGTPVAVNYSLRRTDQGWKAWDVNVEGISYIRSFREDFSAQIDQQGIDAVIKRLESGASPVKSAGAQKSAS